MALDFNQRSFTKTAENAAIDDDETPPLSVESREIDQDRSSD